MLSLFLSFIYFDIIIHMKTKNKLISLSFLTTLLISCTVNPSTIVNPSGKPTSLPLPSVAKTPPAFINPTPTTSSTLSSVAPTAIPSANIGIQEYATVNGKVYDDAGQPLDNIKVTIKSLEDNFSFNVESNTINGSYVFRNVPVGIRLEIKAFKSNDWTTRIQSYVSKGNISGVTQANVVDFGDDRILSSLEKTNFFFLSNAPEIVSIDPTLNKSLSYDNIKFKMTFSEAVNKKSVEDNLVLRYVRESFPPSTVLGDGTDGTVNTDGPPLINGNSQILIDKNVSRRFDWDTDRFSLTGKEVTFNLTSGISLPTSINNLVRYGVSLRGTNNAVKVTDKDGNLALESGEFFINDTRSRNIIYTLEQDRSSPYLEYIDLIKNSNNCIIRLNFSEPMIVEGFSNRDLNNIDTYKIYRDGVLITPNNVNFSSPNSKTLEIKTDRNTFNENQRIKVDVDPNLKDPAGNFFSIGVTLGEIDNIKELRFQP